MNKEITLPIELFDGRLSIAEIGTIGVIMSIPYQKKEILEKWEEDVTLNLSIKELMDCGVIIMEGDQLTLNIEEQPKYKNMKIETAMNELFESGICNEDTLPMIRNVLEEISNDFYYMGYEDGKVDFGVGEDTFTAYGKKEDFV